MTEKNDSMVGYVTSAPEVGRVIGAVSQAILSAFASGDLELLDQLVRALPVPEVMAAVEAAKLAFSTRLATASPSIED